MRQLVEDFFSVQSSFVETYLVYLECRSPGKFACSDLLDEHAVEKRRQLWDNLVRMVGTENEKGPLWNLKDLCHLVWPDANDEQDVSGSLLDWFIGSIFHETMKLKENIYLLDRYGPAAYRIQAGPQESEEIMHSGVLKYTVKWLGNMVDVQGLISRAAGDAVSQMEQVAFLLNHASYLLRLKISEMANNALIVRLLVEKEEMVRQLWSESVEDLFRDMFCGNVAEGFCSAGRSYLGSQWYTQALKMFQSVLEIDPDNDEAILRTAQLKSVVKDNPELQLSV